MIRQQNLVDFDEIFTFAKKKFQIEWNKCCDIFHNEYILIDDEGHDNEFTLDGVNEILIYPEKFIYGYTPQKKLAYEIIQSFMENHKLNSMLVLNRF